MTWIKCSERMPTTAQRVLVFAGSIDSWRRSIDCGWREETDKGESVWYWGDGQCVDEAAAVVSHWMPLPDGPDHAERLYAQRLEEHAARVDAVARERGVTREQAEELVHQANLRIAREINRKLYADVSAKEEENNAKTR